MPDTKALRRWVEVMNYHYFNYDSATGRLSDKALCGRPRPAYWNYKWTADQPPREQCCKRCYEKVRTK